MVDPSRRLQSSETDAIPDEFVQNKEDEGQLEFIDSMEASNGNIFLKRFSIKSYGMANVSSCPLFFL